MKKYIVSLITALILCLMLAVPVLAADMPRLVDDADLLTDSEEISLIAKLDEISERQDFDIVIVTANTIDGSSPMDYADDFYDYNGYRFDGALLLISMEDNDWWVSTKGYGITAITDAGLNYMSDKFVPKLSDGQYADGFDTFATMCDDFVNQARSGEPYDVSNLPKDSFPLLRNLIIALAIGFVIALIAVSVMKYQMKSIRSQPEANKYVRNGSMNVTESRDLFLYTKIDRRAKPKDNGGSSTHSSSSGSTHGGGGGKF